ncbi:MAG: adenine phosphoribosyltransferase [Aeromonadales bacterium]|nr:adenine phosphoribosyltransferase [Aeromonadales bacterium]
MIDTSKIKDFDKRIEKIKESIAYVQDFPIKGILFRDITTLLEDKDSLKETIDLLVDAYKDKNIDYVVAADARGFLFGTALAYFLGCGVVLVRKPGKLPRKTISQSYDLEYGKNVLEISVDSIKKGDNVLLIDDLLATGGTAGAMIQLVRKLEANIVSFAFVIELFDLGGSKYLKDNFDVDTFSLVKFPGH